MSRAAINTGNIAFNKPDDSPTKVNKESPMRIAVIGDFSGRANRSICEPETISQGRGLVINKDNFDRLFTSMNIALRLPSSEELVCFSDFDDLHPDFLYDRLPLFSHLKQLQRQLLNPEQFEQAAREIQQWSDFKSSQPSVEVELACSDKAHFDNMLDAILSSSQQPHFVNSPDGQIDQLIKDIIAPYISEKTDPRQADLLAAVNAAYSDAMRKLLHHSDFQQLEASWRSLYLLIRQLENNPKLEICLFDITKQELAADLQQADNELDQSQIFKVLVDQQSQQGQVPYQVILGDFFIEPDTQDLSVVIDMSAIAQSVNGSFIGGARESLAGCDSLANAVDPDDWDSPLSKEFSDNWAAICDFDACQHTALLTPRFLLRLPYGKKTASTENFDFEELPAKAGHEFYLWGNSAYLQVLLLAESYNRSGWNFKPGQQQQISNMPLHIYQVDDEQAIKPCAEVVLTDRSAEQLQKAGLTVVRSVHNQDKVVISQVNSLAKDVALQGPWSV